jgi:hypothetical protein
MDWFWRRKVEDKSYVMHKGLFILMSVLILSAFAWAVVVTNGDDTIHPYLTCTDSKPCINPLFNSLDCGIKIPSDSDVCVTELILPGQSLGVAPPFIVSWFWSLVLFVMVLVLLLNHLLFNRNFFRKGFFKDWLKEDDSDEVKKF